MSQEEDVVLSELNQYESNFIFFQSQIENLRERFPNKFVAIKDNDVISSGNSIESLKIELNSMGLEPSGTFIEFVPRDEQILVL